jgi:hypothetical protein
MDRRELLRKLGDILGVKPDAVPEALAKLKRETEEMERELKAQ